MTAPYGPPSPQYPAPPPVQPQNGMGVAGFVLGLVGLIFSFIPVIGLVAWPMVIIGLVLSILGLVKANKGQADNRGLAITGIVLSAAGLVVCVAWVALFGLFGAAAHDVVREADKEHTVVYEVTGDAPTSTVTYNSFSGASSGSSQEDVTALPWTKQLTAKGVFSGGMLTATTGPAGGTVTCKITVDGVQKKTATGSGPFSSASCTGF